MDKFQNLQDTAETLRQLHSVADQVYQRYLTEQREAHQMLHELTTQLIRLNVELSIPMSRFQQERRSALAEANSIQGPVQSEPQVSSERRDEARRQRHCQRWAHQHAEWKQEHDSEDSTVHVKVVGEEENDPEREIKFLGKKVVTKRNRRHHPY